MRVLVGLLNVGLGCVYTSYGVMTLVDLRRGWASKGELYFGLAWIAMAFTCGPHHLEHGQHLLSGYDHGGGALDAVAVLVGLPAGATWFLLRVEAFRGGRGDRYISGKPLWVAALPFLAIVYAGAMAAAATAALGSHPVFRPQFAANAWLFVLYMLIGYYLLRTQISTYRAAGGWSVSGLTLGIVFPTCALMHVAWVIYASAGVYSVHWHILVIDWLSVPAALYFVWVVRALFLGELDLEPSTEQSSDAVQPVAA